MGYKVKVSKFDGSMFGSYFEELEQANTWINNQKKKNSWGKPERIVKYSKYQAQDPRAELIRELTDGSMECKIPAEYEIVIEEAQGPQESEHVWKSLRVERNKLLQDCDKTQLADYPLTSAEKKEWRDYRSYLRNITKSYDNVTVYKYRLMDFDEYKLWKYGK